MAQTMLANTYTMGSVSLQFLLRGSMGRWDRDTGGITFEFRCRGGRDLVTACRCARLWVCSLLYHIATAQPFYLLQVGPGAFQGSCASGHGSMAV